MGKHCGDQVRFWAIGIGSSPNMFLIDGVAKGIVVDNPGAGEMEIPAHTKMAYFAQHAAEVLDGKLTVLESLEDIASNDWRPRLRGLLPGTRRG